MEPLSAEEFRRYVEQDNVSRRERVTEQDRRHDELSGSIRSMGGRLETIDGRVDDHELRLLPIERSRARFHKFGWALLIGGLGVGWDFVANHLSKFSWK